MSLSEEPLTLSVSIEHRHNNIPEAVVVVCSVSSCLEQVTIGTEGLAYGEWCGLPEYTCPGCDGQQHRSALSIVDNGEWCSVAEEATDRRLQRLLDRHEKQKELNAAELLAANVVGTMEEAYDKLADEALRAVQQQVEWALFGGGEVPSAEVTALNAAPLTGDTGALPASVFGGVTSDGVGE